MANPTPTPPAGGTTVLPDQVKGLIEEILAFFKEFLKINLDLGTLAGLADPELDKLAKSHAAAVKKWLKKGSWLLHPLMGRAIGAFSGRLDTVADKLTEPVKTLVRKLSDYLDSFRGELYGEESGKEHQSKMDDVTDAEFLKAWAECKAAILKNTTTASLESTTPGELKAVEDAGEKQALAIWRVMKRLTEGPEKSEEPKVPFRERLADAAHIADEAANRVLAPINCELGQGLAKWDASLKARQQARAAGRTTTSGSLIAKAFKWLARP